MQGEPINNRESYLEILEVLDKRDRWGNVYCKCRCKCGEEKEILRTKVVNRKVISCGCMSRKSQFTTVVSVEMQAKSTQKKMANILNGGVARNNASGVTGVCYDSRAQRWIATIQVNHKRMRLGSYLHMEDAVKARKQAEEVYLGDLVEI